MLECVLILTNSEDATADYLCLRLERSGVEFVRYDTDTDFSSTRFVYSGTRPTISWQERIVSPDQISTIVLRRPKPLKPTLEGDPYTIEHITKEWAEAWEGFLAHLPDRIWINHPAQNFKASHKIEQLTRAKRFGLHIPQTLVTNDEAEARCFVEQQRNGTIVKPLASGYIERLNPRDDTVIHTHEFRKQHHSLLDTISTCPVLFQQLVQKAIDVRMTVLDGAIIAVGLEAKDVDGRQRLDIRRYNMSDVSYKDLDVPDGISNSVRAILNSYGLRFAALDFAITADNSWIFFEINPNGQWAWLDLDAGTDIGGLFVAACKTETGQR